MYYRLGKIHLDSATGNAEAPLRAAKAMLIRACQYKPTASAWLGVGKACFRLQEYADAEDALTVRQRHSEWCANGVVHVLTMPLLHQEANFLNNRDGEIWANIALLCLTVQRRFEANQALVQALKMGVRDAAVLE